MGTFTVFFDGQFWVGIATREGDAGAEIARVVFGPEPTDTQLVYWFRDDYRKLVFMPASGATEPAVHVHSNPKRRLREIRRALEEPRTHTRAQQAFGLALAATKTVAAAALRDERRSEADLSYALRVAKRKKKHRGR